MLLEDKIRDIIEPIIEEEGYELAVIRINGNEHQTLQVMIDRMDQKKITVEDCSKISLAISPILDVEDPISEKYSLEVSSPGIDRPLTRLKDFKRFSGFKAKIQTIMPVDNRRKYSITLIDVMDNNIIVRDSENNELSIEFSNIAKAKLLLTDELIQATSKGVV